MIRHLKKFMVKLETAISAVITVLTFLAILPSILYMVYFLFISFDLYKVIGGAVVAYLCVHINKSM